MNLVVGVVYINFREDISSGNRKGSPRTNP